MNSSATPSTTSNWVRVWIAVSSALLAFGICQLAVVVVFIWMKFFDFLLPINNFLWPWHYILVPVISLITAILVSRWAEHKLSGKSRRTGIIAGTLFAITGLLALDVRIETKYSLASPLEMAIFRHYSVETIEAIIDRYPHLVNGYGGMNNYSPLVDAALEARTNLVELLIRKGAFVDRAVQRLQQQENEESAVKLVLDCSKAHDQLNHPGTNQTSSAVGSTF